MPDELKNPSNDAYQLSSKVTDYFKLDNKTVYKKIIDGSFVISPHKITKTKHGTLCWQNRFQLVLEKKTVVETSGGYNDTGYLIYHKVDHHGGYYG